ncbi:thioredoxin domain-containing protein [Paenibacillus sp. LMG 31460]|uniref:Thioredoxin domain-containing protein n=1 Tax=Paenibacillus germinis TaxID=2654979 RepID=A0ABX1Z5G4_9BACL|nr:DsbA family oxidoreductase [Paenibacillus germinis]NOU88488.1 thioredoxin domain-containing protein [Paenibacillus germinis]
MRIEVWSDFGCPFCVIGKRKLENALGKFTMGDKVEVVYRSFQLDPNAENRTISTQQLAQEKGMTVEQLKAKQAQVANMIKKEAGLDVNYDQVIIANTFDGHRLVHFAAKVGKGAELTERLIRAYLSQRMNIADHNVLVSLGSEAGLNEQDLAEMLESDAYKDSVKADIAEARKLNISSAPTFVFNNKFLISGAQSEEDFLNALNSIWDEEKKFQELELKGESKGDNSCTDGVCNV